jgi:hypothetical protein
VETGQTYASGGGPGPPGPDGAPAAGRRHRACRARAGGPSGALGGRQAGHGDVPRVFVVQADPAPEPVNFSPAVTCVRGRLCGDPLERLMEEQGDAALKGYIFTGRVHPERYGFGLSGLPRAPSPSRYAG